MSDPTHVLYWVPPEVTGGPGEWGLTDIASYEAGIPQSDPEWIIESADRDLDAAGIAEWIAVRAGCPVTAEKSAASAAFLREAGWHQPEPVWHVHPAGPEAVAT